MLKASEMWEVFERCIEDYHQQDDVDTAENNPYPKGSLEQLLYSKNWIDTVQWHLEDIVRDPEIAPEKGLAIKRRIDKSNQNRTDLVEQIDDALLDEFREVTPAEDARLNTESPAWAIDRLSILALKVYHMSEQAERTDIAEELKDKNSFKLNVLKVQKEDLSLAIDQLLEDLASGRRRAKVYRQMKMYNDPELNPFLYRRKNG